MRSASIEELDGIQDFNFFGNGLGEINIGEIPMDVYINQMKRGLNEVVRGMEVIKGDDGRIPSNGEASRGPRGINHYRVTSGLEPGYA